MTGMLNGANPLFATIVASYVLKRAPSRGVAIGLAVGMAGTVLIALPAMNEGQNSAVGVALIVAALVSYGFALSIARSLQQKYGAIPVIWRAQGIALLLTAPLGLPELMKAHWDGRTVALHAGAGYVWNGDRERGHGFRSGAIRGQRARRAQRS